jgi:hypothetical protein
VADKKKTVAAKERALAEHAVLVLMFRVFTHRQGHTHTRAEAVCQKRMVHRGFTLDFRLGFGVWGLMFRV